MGVEKVALSSAALADPGSRDEHGERRRRPERRHGARRSARQTRRRDGVDAQRRAEHGQHCRALAAKVMADSGAGEIIVNSIDNDGVMQGYDLPLIADVLAAVSVPVTALGGAGSLAHIRTLIERFGLDRRRRRKPVRVQRRVPRGVDQLSEPCREGRVAAASRRLNEANAREAGSAVVEGRAHDGGGRAGVRPSRSRQLLIATSRTLISAGTERIARELRQGELLQQGPPAAGQGADGPREDQDRRARADARGGAQQARSTAADGLLQRRHRGRRSGDGVAGFRRRRSRRLERQARRDRQRARQSVREACRTAVTDDAAAFAVLGAIALQGIRLAQPTLGRGGRRHGSRACSGCSPSSCCARTVAGFSASIYDARQARACAPVRRGQPSTSAGGSAGGRAAASRASAASMP